MPINWKQKKPPRRRRSTGSSPLRSEPHSSLQESKENTNISQSQPTENPSESQQPWTTVSSRRKPRKWKKVTHSTMDDMFPPKQEEFIVIEPEKDKKLSKRLEKIFELLEETANIKRDNISDLKGGKLLIKTTSDESSRKLKELDHILECPIKAFSHPTLNQVQGTIYSNFLMDEPTETLLDQWKKFGVIGVYRFTTFQNGEVKPTPRLLLTFKGLNLPSKLNLGWRQYDIRQHIPTPRRCYKCNRIGHSQKICRSSKS